MDSCAYFNQNDKPAIGPVCEMDATYQVTGYFKKTNLLLCDSHARWVKRMVSKIDNCNVQIERAR